MSKIRVIDLLNKIVNGEEVPKNIRFEGADFRLENDTYYRTNTLFSLIDYIKLKRSSLNEDVEIIAEEPEIDMQNKNETNWEKIGEMFGKMYLEFAKGFYNALEQLGIELDNRINNK